MAAGFSGYSGGSFGRGEELVTCPYDKTHRINNRKFDEHLRKCRRNYREMQLKQGTELLWMCCKYNPTHKLDIPELLFHESRCVDRIHRLPIQLICSKKAMEKDIGVKMTDEMFVKLTKDQFAAMRVGIYDGPPVQTRSILGPLIVQEQGARGDGGDETGNNKLEDDPIARTHASLFRNVKGGKKVHLNVREEIRRFIGEEFGTPDPESDGEKEEDTDDGEDWNTPAKGPTVNFMQNLYNPRKPQWTYPPGLSKANRREYDKWNSRFMQRIYRKTIEDEAQMNPF